MKRRDFILRTATAGFAIGLPFAVHSLGLKNKGTITFAVCADVHKDIMHDADERLKTFVEAAEKNNSDFIIHLGDFCRPYDVNKSFLDVWNSFPGNNYHVIGNHDMDGGFTREQVLEFWNSPAKYYSFDVDDFHFIVLDGNDKNPSENRASGYARYIGKEQQEWLKKDMQSTEKQIILFSHQSLENKGGIENGNEIRQLLVNENKRAGFTKVIASFSGHHHTDFCTQIDNIYYIQINSMSYSWLGDKYKTVRYSKKIDEKYPWIKYTAPYREPIFAIVEIGNGKIEITGKETDFVGITPQEMGVNEEAGSPIVPKISDRRIKI